MGVLNVTPDSFADASPALMAGEPVDVAATVARAVAMEASGADLIDVGGESTRPGAQPVTADEEMARVLPVVKAVCRAVRVPVSIDTYKPEVASRAVGAGASLINDISGLQYEPSLARVAAETGAGLILMHTRGRSTAMYVEAVYADLIREIGAELERSLAVAMSAGVDRSRIIVDPGIGFAKRTEHSYGVLACFSDLAERLDRPMLIGPSRKSFLRVATGDRPAAERDWGTAAAVTAAVLAGAHIVRVHAVPELVQVVNVAEEIRRAGLTGTPEGAPR
jgi:dihydropteroate synthase